MREYLKPLVVVSRCLGFDDCRYNGQRLSNPVVEKLRGHVEFIDVCPEADVGLGVPRDPIRVVEDEGLKLIQPATGLEHTGKMNGFVQDFLSSLPEVDGFILKNRSPSCGIKDVKIYGAGDKSFVKGKGAGFFGRKVLESHPIAAIEDDGRLRHIRLRQDFLTRLFMHARLRQVWDVKSLTDFHARHKYILMSYSPGDLKRLGVIAANQEGWGFREVFDGYKTVLGEALGKNPTTQKHINVLNHLLGYFKKDLNTKEKKLFLDKIEEYRDERITLSVLTSMIESWNKRSEKPYLSESRYLDPYPRQLVMIDDTCMT